jgi:hypothetical protein
MGEGGRQREGARAHALEHFLRERLREDGAVIARGSTKDGQNVYNKTSLRTFAQYHDLGHAPRNIKNPSSVAMLVFTRTASFRSVEVTYYPSILPFTECLAR